MESVRIIQRFGRIDRIGSINNVIQLINFWPQVSLDDYINLKSRVEGRMHLVNFTATGDDNVLTNESSDIEFRKQQLETSKRNSRYRRNGFWYINYRSWT